MKRGVRSLEDVDEDSFMKNTMHTHTITTSYYSLLTTRHIEKTIIETIDYYYYYYNAVSYTHLTLPTIPTV